MRIDPSAATFEGSVDIAVRVHEPVSEIVLNAKDLTIGSCRVLTPAHEAVVDAEAVLDPAAERVCLRLSTGLVPGDHIVRIAFGGPINDEMRGIYRSTFRDAGDREHALVTMHYQPTGARRKWPCWDEPDLKAIHAITLVVPEGDLALTNTAEVAREAAESGFVRIRFADSVAMSTYLVCIVVGPLHLTELVVSRGVPMRIASRPDAVHLAAYANEVGARALDWYTDYFAMPYVEEKLDQVAIPDFAAGAMENMGLIQYRESLLLLDPATATPVERSDVTGVVAHEIAHMWFGNAATMRWWNGIWLSEAFATFMSYLCVDALEPSWSVFDEFQSGRVRAFEIDSLATTRPIEYPVESPDDAAGMFDILTYTKGGAVLRMIEQWLEPGAFRDGIRAYLTAFAYGNADTRDLWDAIETVSGQPVRRIMEPWIFQPGYPAVTVRLDAGSIRLQQRRFAPSLPGDTTTWPVPLIVRQTFAGGERTDRVLVEADGLTLDLADPAATVIANSGSTAFARTVYDDILQARLVERASSDLRPAERLSLVDDAWAAVIAGVAPVSSFIGLARGFTSESSPAVWRVLVNGLTWCDRFLDGPARERFRAMIRSLVGPALDRVGWEVAEHDGTLVRELRGDLIRALGILGNDRTTQVRARAVERAAGEAPGSDDDPSVVAAAIDVVAASGDADDFGRFAARMDHAATPQDRDRYRDALATFGDAASMQRTLDLVATGAIRAQDAPFLLYRAMGQRDHGPLAWRYVRDEWLELTSRFAETNVIALGAGACRLTTPDEVAEVQEFFTEDRIPQDRLTMRQQLERQRLFAAARVRMGLELAELFGAD